MDAFPGLPGTRMPRSGIAGSRGGSVFQELSRFAFLVRSYLVAHVAQAWRQSAGVQGHLSLHPVPPDLGNCDCARTPHPSWGLASTPRGSSNGSRAPRGAGLCWRRPSHPGVRTQSQLLGRVEAQASANKGLKGQLVQMPRSKQGN